MVIYYGEPNPAVVSYLTENKYIIRYPLMEDSKRVVRDTIQGCDAKNGKRLVVERFFDYWRYLRDENYRYVIATDVTDVLFQTNPSDWLQTHMGDKKLNVGSESILYKDNWFGRDHIRDSLPWVWDWIQNKIIYNAGTFSGDCKVLADVSLAIYSICAHNNNHNWARPDSNY